MGQILILGIHTEADLEASGIIQIMLAFKDEIVAFFSNHLKGNDIVDAVVAILVCYHADQFDIPSPSSSNRVAGASSAGASTRSTPR